MKAPAIPVATERGGAVARGASALVVPPHAAKSAMTGVPKAMAITLTTPEDVDVWLMAPVVEDLDLERLLPDDVLMIVTRGERRDALKGALHDPS